MNQVLVDSMVYLRKTSNHKDDFTKTHLDKYSFPVS